MPDASQMLVTGSPEGYLAFLHVSGLDADFPPAFTFDRIMAA